MARGLPHKSLLLFPEVNAAEAGFVELFELLCVSMLDRLATHLVLALRALGCGPVRPHVIFILDDSLQSLFVQITLIGFVILVDGQITVGKLLIIFFVFLFCIHIWIPRGIVTTVLFFHKILNLLRDGIVQHLFENNLNLGMDNTFDFFPGTVSFCSIFFRIKESGY